MHANKASNSYLFIYLLTYLLLIERVNIRAPPASLLALPIPLRHLLPLIHRRQVVHLPEPPTTFLLFEFLMMVIAIYNVILINMHVLKFVCSGNVHIGNYPP